MLTIHYLCVIPLLFVRTFSFSFCLVFLSEQCRIRST